MLCPTPASTSSRSTTGSRPSTRSRRDRGRAAPSRGAAHAPTRRRPRAWRSAGQRPATSRGHAWQAAHAAARTRFQAAHYRPDARTLPIRGPLAEGSPDQSEMDVYAQYAATSTRRPALSVLRAETSPPAPALVATAGVDPLPRGRGLRRRLARRATGRRFGGSPSSTLFNAPASAAFADAREVAGATRALLATVAPVWRAGGRFRRELECERPRT